MALNPRLPRVLARSVFLQVVALAALVTALVAMILTVQSSITTAALSKDGIRQVAQENITNLTAASGGAIKFGKIDSIQEMLDTVVDSRADAYFAFAVDAEGQIIAEAGMEDRAGIEAMTVLAQAAMEQGERQISTDGFRIAEKVLFGKKDTVVGAIGTAWTPEIIMTQVARDRNITIGVAVAVFAGLMLAFGMILKRRISTPLETLGSSMGQISNGNYDIDVPLRGRADEIGQIAKSLGEMLGKLHEAKEESRRRDHARNEQERVVKQLTLALQDLSEGDLMGQLDEPFPEGYDSLRTNLNDAKRKLREMILSVMDGAGNVRDNVGAIATASDNLSHRTESQAATLEQTTAALEEMTASIVSAAEMAKTADSHVSDAQRDASAGEKIVQGAVAAMKEIESSSKEISQIIGVIDDIAFQTNLLALNAGVEAARAGESGRGFAVVAAEVRALAQRASDAAKEINGLISTSVEQVERGSALVLDTGAALQKIVSNTDMIRKVVADMASATGEQSIGLGEINTAMTQLDSVTQQNAAMVQEATASCHDLTREAGLLVTQTQSFQVRAGGQAYGLSDLAA